MLLRRKTLHRNPCRLHGIGSPQEAPISPHVEVASLRTVTQSTRSTIRREIWSATSRALTGGRIEAFTNHGAATVTPLKQWISACTLTGANTHHMFGHRKFHPVSGAGHQSGSLSSGALVKHEDVTEEGETAPATRSRLQEVGIQANRASNPVVFLDVSIGGSAARLTFELRKDIVPRTAENFRSLCAGDRPAREDGTRLSYQGCPFHRVVKDFAVVGGDIANHDGTGGVSVYGGPFADENFILRHRGPGVLTCCNAGPDTNTSAFMITTVEAPWLDDRCVVFGYLANAESFEALDKMEQCGGESGQPSAYIQITACGQLFPPQEKTPTTGKSLGGRRKS